MNSTILNKLQDQIFHIIHEKKYDSIGMTIDSYENFEDLKSKNEFLTCNSKDKWLNIQIVPFKPSQLKERWFKIKSFYGGELFAPESDITFLGGEFN